MRAQTVGGAAIDPVFEAALRLGGCALMIRHGATEPGIGDPPGFRLDQCATQRNLSEAGRAQSRALGAWLASRGLRPQRVRSSAWCRCRDTADLAFGTHETWPALNSFFGARDGEAAQTAELRAALSRIPAARFEAWVTHQVNITALTGSGVAMGEALVVDARGAVVARAMIA